MEKITYLIDRNKIEHALIEHADGSFTSMLKSTYDAMQAEQSTPNLAGLFNE
jgi:hypothetical protein